MKILALILLLTSAIGFSADIPDFESIDKSTLWSCERVLEDLIKQRDDLHRNKKISSAEPLNRLILELRVYIFQTFDRQSDPVIGAWSWFNGGRIYLDENGSLYNFTNVKQKKIKNASWSLADKKELIYKIHWGKDKFVDTLKLNVSNGRIEGRNQHGGIVYGTTYK